MSEKHVKCCDEGEIRIKWVKADPFNGPAKDGWALGFHSWGDVDWEGISFCPFCGTAVPEAADEQ